MTVPPTAGQQPDDAEQTCQAQEAFTEAAHLLASQPGAVQRALIEHRATADGRCRRCGATTRWPCAMATIAHQAVPLALP
jgi:hypothetical protein